MGPAPLPDGPAVRGEPTQAGRYNEESVRAAEGPWTPGPRLSPSIWGVPAELIARAHDWGIAWLQTVGDRPSAEAALAAGADVLVAQGSEAGGNSGWVSSLALIPSVVHAAGDVPVVAAGGIADGRGLAAALVLGAQGASLGTRFLATTDMRVSAAWKQRITEAGALGRGQGADRRAGHAAVQPPPAGTAVRSVGRSVRR